MYAALSSKKKTQPQRKNDLSIFARTTRKPMKAKEVLFDNIQPNGRKINDVFTTRKRPNDENRVPMGSFFNDLDPFKSASRRQSTLVKASSPVIRPIQNVEEESPMVFEEDPLDFLNATQRQPLNLSDHPTPGHSGPSMNPLDFLNVTQIQPLNLSSHNPAPGHSGASMDPLGFMNVTQQPLNLSAHNPGHSTSMIPQTVVNFNRNMARDTNDRASKTKVPLLDFLRQIQPPPAIDSSSSSFKNIVCPINVLDKRQAEADQIGVRKKKSRKIPLRSQYQREVIQTPWISKNTTISFSKNQWNPATTFKLGLTDLLNVLCGKRIELSTEL